MRTWGGHKKPVEVTAVQIHHNRLNFLHICWRTKGSNLEPLQQTLADFARTSNTRWIAANPTAKISQLPIVERANGKPAFLRFAFENPRKARRHTRSVHSGWIPTKMATISFLTW